MCAACLAKRIPWEKANRTAVETAIAAAQAARAGDPDECLALALRRALDALDQVTGLGVPDPAHARPQPGAVDALGALALLLGGVFASLGLWWALRSAAHRQAQAASMAMAISVSNRAARRGRAKETIWATSRL